MKTHVGPYRIEEMLGRGGMGEVYRGFHEHLGRQVAIKALAPELTQQPEFKERFFSEARTQARLHHPNIVTVYDLIEDGGEFFIVMEHVVGRTCDDLLKENAGCKLPLGEAVGIFSQILAALDYAHSEGVIHRDVKPSNVLLTLDGRVKLMDFGIALLIGDKRLTSSQASIGTPIYMSPEQILRPREMDHRTDIYSAAIVFYELVAGKPPFDAETMYEISKLQIEAPPPDLAEGHPEVPQTVAAVVRRALAKHPDERFISAGEMLRAFREATGTAPASGPATFPPEPVSPPRSPAPRPAPLTATPGKTPLSLPVPAAGRKARPLGKLLPPVAARVLLAAVALAVLLSRRPPAAVDSTAGTPGTAGSAAVLPAEVPQTGLAPARASVEAASVEAANRPERERRIPIRRPVSPTSPADSHFADHEARRLEVLRVRDALGRGIASVRTDLEGQQFTAAREQLSQLQERTVPYRADLIDEVATLRALDQEITSTQISLKTNALAKQQEEAKWQQRLQQIQSLLDDKGYPEADKMASRLESEPGVPEEVAAKAHALRDAARQALKEIFGTTKIKTREEIVKRPPL